MAARAEGGARVGIVVEGEDAGKIRQHLARLAPSGVVVVDERGLSEALAKNGLGGDLGGRINQASARGNFVAQAVATAKTLNLGLIIFIRRIAPKDVAWVFAVNGQTGEEEIDREVGLVERAGPKPKKGKKRPPPTIDYSELDTEVQALFMKAPKGGAAAAPSAGDDEGTAAAEPVTPRGTNWGAADWGGGSSGGGAGSSPSSGSSSSSISSGSSRLLQNDKRQEVPEAAIASSKTPRRKRGTDVSDAFIVLRPVYTLSMRTFSYANRQTDNLRPYEAKLVSLLGAELEAYPAVVAAIPVVENIGVKVGYRQALGLKSSPKDNNTVKLTTTWKELDAALCYRLVLHPMLINVAVGYGSLAFTFNIPAGDPLAGQAPDLTYTFVRPSLDLRVTAGPVVILAGGGYRYVLGTGKLGKDYFPDGQASGFDGNLGVAYPIASRFEAYALGFYTRFTHALNPASGATYVAKSATDAYYGGRLGVQFHI
ncbi:MAG: hypothetical protein HY903_01690 [Deltaproteobacteria bacterium]|nr:hypothetical protein [Deltaproteobacteria bacterium]